MALFQSFQCGKYNVMFYHKVSLGPGVISSIPRGIKFSATDNFPDQFPQKYGTQRSFQVIPDNLQKPIKQITVVSVVEF